MPSRLMRELTPRQRAAAKSLPSASRTALSEWCDVLRHIDETVHNASAVGGGAFIARMQALQKLPTQLASGDARCGYPALAECMARQSIPAALLRECIEGASLDLVRAQPRDQAQLDQFLFKIAGVPLLVACRLAGTAEEELRPTIDRLGALAQSISQLPRISEDLARGRIYLTLEAMNAGGVTREELGRQEMSPALWEFAKQLADENARQLDQLQPQVEAMAPDFPRAFALATHTDAAESLRAWAAKGHAFFAPPPPPTLAMRIRGAFGRSPK